MRYLALACDYDGTLATDGRVPPHVIEALKRLRESNRRIVLVTGRRLDDLRTVFPQLELFDQIVVENGAVVFVPETREERVLAEPPPPAFVATLQAHGVGPIAHGRVIVATWEPHEARVLEVIRELGLELQVIFNKGAVMVLPTGINKAAGLRVALEHLGVSQHNAVGVGDAENDHALLSECEVGVAVQNALPGLKERADWVTPGARGDGVAQLIERMLQSDLRELEPALSRWDIELGVRDSGERVALHPYGRRTLLCGSSGGGKSTLMTGLLERFGERGYQFCLIDPEGDYDGFADAVVIGDDQTAPSHEEVFELLLRAPRSVVVNLLCVPFERRGAWFSALSTRLLECRARCGRPHWIVVDEAHHMLPEGAVELTDALEHVAPGTLFITVDPLRLSPRVLRSIDEVIVVGDAPRTTLHAFAHAVSAAAPEVDPRPLPRGEALLWKRAQPAAPQRFRATPPRSERHRHLRKYATGALGEDKSFYFRGPRDALNLRAHNLALFLQIADGVDDQTWLHHLGRHDYSRWLREAIKNPELAATVFAIEARHAADARTTRKEVRDAIQKVYTLPA
jgi:hydroxymethylpyrimidine pyrophosphatase-like HAD family hydrolase